jgi:PAS domain S-box-containing protein
MRITKDKPDDSRNLREQAEKRAKQQIVEFRKQRGQDTAELVHELRVHQIELEIQNEELRNTQLALAESRNKYCELYDFAPVGYFTLDKEGLIVGANLTGAAFLGEQRDNLLKSKFSHFIAPSSQDEFYLHRKQVVESRTRQSCEVKLRRKDGTEFPAQLVSVAVAEQKGEYDQFRMTMIDITEREKAEEALRESEAKLSNAMKIAKLAYWEYDAVKDQFTFNDQFYRIFRTTAEKVGGYIMPSARYAELFVHPEDSKMVGIEIKKALETTDPNFSSQLEHRIIYADGEIGHITVRYFIVKDSQGRTVKTYGANQDITERKQTEQKFKESETRFRELFNNMSSGVAIYEAVDDGSDFVFRDFNAAGQRIDKTSREDTVDKRVTQVFPGVKAMGLLDVFRRVWQTGRAEQHPTTLYKDSRISGWRENYVYKLPNGEIVAVYDDVTKRQLAQEYLQEERNLLRTLIDHIPDKVYVKDRGSRFIVCNKSTIVSNGVKSEEELIGKTDFDLYEQALAQQFFDKEQELMRTGRPIIDCEIQASDGSVRSMLVTQVPLRDHSGNIVGMVGINRDITERKQVEHKILEYQKHLKQLAARLTLTEERERRRIAGELHDEISQTLAIVNIKLDTLRNSPPFKASAAEIEEISSSVEKVIQETRTLTFELSNPILYELGFEVAVAEWLSERVQVKHGIATEFQDDSKAKLLDDDVKVMLFRNIRELLINCIKHANAGKVRVNIRRTDGSIEVVVEDNGVGFDPAEAGSTAGKRAKFGLFSVRESLENLGGHFIIESKPGAGCKAIMTAPLKDQSHKKEV